MRIVLTIRGYDPAVTNVASCHVRAMAGALRAAGHEVVILSEGVALDDIECAVVPPADDGEWLGPDHAYADRLFERLLTLGHVDAIEVAVAGGEGLTVARARRLGCDLARTRVVARLHGPPPGAPDESRPVSYRDDLRHFAERYVLAHADLVSVDSAAAGIGCARPRVWPTPIAAEVLDRSAARLGGAPRRVLFLGDLEPRTRYDAFAATAGIVAARDPGLRFEVYGSDTLTDPFGRSYRDWVARHETPGHAALTWHAAPCLDELTGVLAEPAICVFPGAAPRFLIDAVRACGGVVLAPPGAAPSGTYLSTAGAGPQALADRLLGLRADVDEARRAYVRGRADVRRRCAPQAVAERAERAYRHERRPPARPAVTGPVSVVIPLFNQGSFVREAVASVRASAGVDPEIVVVDDGSTDDATRRVFDALSGVVKVRQPNRGLSAARNSGIARSSGAYVMPLDADDIIHPDYLRTALAALHRNPELGYVNSYVRNFGLFDSPRATIGNVPEVMLFVHTDGQPCGVYQRSALDAVGGFDEDLPGFEDWDMQIRLAKAGFAGDVLPRELVRYRRHADSLVFRSSNRLRVGQLQYLLRKHEDLFAPRAMSVALRLIELWKNHVEVSQSARFANGSALGSRAP
jgi:glycosyltransferase involved in cell wall biosynthesis